MASLVRGTVRVRKTTLVSKFRKMFTKAESENRASEMLHG